MNPNYSLTPIHNDTVKIFSPNLPRSCWDHAGYMIIMIPSPSEFNRLNLYDLDKFDFQKHGNV